MHEDGTSFDLAGSPDTVPAVKVAGPALDRHRAAVRARLRASGMTRSGPGSISWTINREIVVMAGWGRAILLQLAHPLVAAGVNDHSRFRAGPVARLARLRTTIDAMRALTFGDDGDAIAAAARINTIHDRVFGRIPAEAGPFPAHTAYSAHAPDLLCWVHATLVDSLPRAYDILVEPLTPDERDRYCHEAAVMEPLLDMPPGMVPRSSTALDGYLHDALANGTLVVTDVTRALARAVLFPRGWRLLWPVFRPVQLIALGLLPPSLREAYGFAWTRKDALALVRWTTAGRWLRRIVPAQLRQWPSARRRLGAEGRPSLV
jgi:uncharacterized protein (DUF2236 family)